MSLTLHALTLCHLQDYERLKQCWMNEIFSPELLTFEDAIVLAVSNSLRHLRERIDQAKQAHEANQTTQFLTSMLEMDADRVQYVLASYLRVRLAKIERYALYTLAQPAVRARLSDAETAFVKSFVDSLERHFQSSFLSRLPDNPKVRALDTQDGDVDMIPEPELDAYVFVRVLVAHEDIELATVGRLRLDRNQVIGLPYRDVRDYLQQGTFCLI